MSPANALLRSVLVIITFHFDVSRLPSLHSVVQTIQTYETSYTVLLISNKPLHLENVAKGWGWEAPGSGISVWREQLQLAHAFDLSYAHRQAIEQVLDTYPKGKQWGEWAQKRGVGQGCVSLHGPPGDRRPGGSRPHGELRPAPAGCKRIAGRGCAGATPDDAQHTPGTCQAGPACCGWPAAPMCGRRRSSSWCGGAASESTACARAFWARCMRSRGPTPGLLPPPA